MQQTMNVSIILPALQPAPDFLRCIASIKAALAERVSYEIIVVVPAVEDFADTTGADVRVIAQHSAGIYAAMNTGIREAQGEYLYFIGQDDVLLDAAAKAIKCGQAERADLILGDVFWGEQAVFNNHPSRKVLVWQNWCHQGVFYQRDRFIKSVGAFPDQYSAQGDHYVNIVFSSLPGTRISSYDGCIAWYSGEGFSSANPDMAFRAAFPKLIRQHFGILSYWVVVLRRLLLKFFNGTSPKTK
jgi:glycosyltransferase involved in cell wall biosynthesis